MRKLTFASVPPQSIVMPDGHIRVHYNAVETEETSVVINPETGEPTGETETHIVYVCDFVFVSELTVANLVSAIIRKSYSVDDELAILRQKDSKPEEFATYNATAEEAKRIAHELLG